MVGALVIGARLQGQTGALRHVQRDHFHGRVIHRHQRCRAKFRDLLADEPFQCVLVVFDCARGGDDTLLALGDAGLGLNHIEWRHRADPFLDAVLIE